ncbi:DUF1983 domain-containing protein [Candidatus Symbiopectobacterium sp. NZEC127]|uniref:phage tail tip fiber protein n=1 Tax=Candidatus Symbiopectobacterium sp. NZEC127 TaxID=2820472 RepID=UPI0039B3DB43
MRAAEGEIDGLSTAVGGLQTKVTQQGNTLTSQGQSITQITASVGTAQTAADSAKSSAAAAQQAATNAAAAAGNKGKVIYGTAEPAVADRLTQNVWIDTTNSANTPKRWTGSAWQAVTDKAATDAAAAAKSAASAAVAAQSTANGAVQSVNAVSATVTQQGNTITAQGTQISQLTATVNGATTKISDISQAVNGIDGKLSASRTIKVGVDANGKQYLAGIGLDVSNSTTGMQSNIILLADRTSIMTNAGGTPTPVFTTQGTQAVLNSVVIGDATITSAKIKDAAITGAKFSDNISSDNYVAGSSGWKISRTSGSSEFNNVIVRGTVYAKDGRFEGTVYADKIEGDVIKFSVLQAGGALFIPAVPYSRLIAVPYAGINGRRYRSGSGDGATYNDGYGRGSIFISTPSGNISILTINGYEMIQASSGAAILPANTNGTLYWSIINQEHCVFTPAVVLISKGDSVN